MKHPVWLLDLDDTLHDASHAAFAELHVAMADYVAAHLEVDGGQGPVRRWPAERRQLPGQGDPDPGGREEPPPGDPPEFR